MSDPHWTPERAILIGCGGIGGWVAEPAYRLLGNMGIPLCLVDGDRVEVSNLDRQRFGTKDVGGGKADRLLKRLEGIGLNGKIDSSHLYLSRSNTRTVILEKSLVLMAVDNHMARHLAFSHAKTMRDVLILSGGNGALYGNVLAFGRAKRKDGFGNPVDLYPEIADPQDVNPGDVGCDVKIESTPQLLATNFAVAAAMITALSKALGLMKSGLVVDHQSLGYGEVHITIPTNGSESHSRPPFVPTGIPVSAA